MDAKKNLNQNDIIYMLMTDRFNIDSEAKLTEGREECCKPGECLTLYNGGNWEGITKKLDYLKKLGVTAIWISPVSKNVPMFMKEAAFAEASCSGYMTQDYSEPNEHFGTWDNLKRLSEEIHNRGMKLILDVVPNHTADYFISGEKKWKDENRKPAAPFDNIEWYHHKGNVGNWDDEKQVKEGDLGFLADLDQENKDVKEALFNVHHLLVEKANADGLRVDAAKCMQPDFVGEFEKEMDIPTFGEVFDGNVDKIAEYKKRQWGVLDFPLYFAISDVFVDNHNFTRISNVLAEDYKYKNANTMVTFLDNHDRNRFLSVAKDNFEKLRLALAFLFTCRGVPTIYYGTEQNMYGSDRSTDDCGITSKYNREMMKSFAEDNGTYKFIQRLCKIRKSNKCLTEGKQKELMCFEDVYAFSRSLEKEKEIITVINKGENPFSIVVPFENNDIGEVLVDLLTGKEINCDAMKEEDKTYYNVRVDSCSVMILSLRKKGEIDSFDIVKNTTQFEFIHKLEKGNTIWIRGDIYPLFSQNGCRMEARALHTHFVETVFPFLKGLNYDEESAFSKYMQHATFKINDPLALQKVVIGLEDLFENDIKGLDLQGDLYEHMLGKLNSAGRLGAFRTPQHIRKLMVALMEPTADTKICDPACGTAGFLISSAEYIREHYKMTSEQLKAYKTELFTGFDTDETMCRLSCMNMMLHSVTNPKIKKQDSVSMDYQGKDIYDLILANPPFKGTINKENINTSLSAVTSTTKTELLFVALFIRMLRIGGRCACIVPDGVLFGSSKAHKSLRKELIENQSLEGVISMPSGVFKPYAGVSTAILIFTKTNGGTDKVWFYDMKADGYSLDDKRQPIQENDIPDIIERFHNKDNEVNRKRTEQSFVVEKQEIVDNDYDLSINKYKKIEYVPVEYPPTEEILKEIEDLNEQIIQETAKLRELLAK